MSFISNRSNRNQMYYCPPTTNSSSTCPGELHYYSNNSTSNMTSSSTSCPNTSISNTCPTTVSSHFYSSIPIAPPIPDAPTNKEYITKSSQVSSWPWSIHYNENEPILNLENSVSISSSIPEAPPISNTETDKTFSDFDYVNLSTTNQSTTPLYSNYESNYDNFSESDSMPGLESDTEPEPVPEPPKNNTIRLVRPSNNKLSNLKDGHYDITYKGGDQYVGYIVNCEYHGSGSYTYSSKTGYPDNKTGNFVNGYMTLGVYTQQMRKLIGSFIEHDDEEFLHGNDNIIEFKSGIKYEGYVNMDNPTSSGNYYLTHDVFVEKNGYYGLLSRNNECNSWTVLFSEGSIYSITGQHFNLFTNNFSINKPVTIYFRDGSTFSGIDYGDDSYTYNNTYYYPPCVNVSNWNMYQSVLYLMSTFNYFPETFFEHVTNHNMTVQHLYHCDTTILKKLGLNEIQCIQLYSEISNFFKNDGINYFMNTFGNVFSNVFSQLTPQ